MGVSCQPNNDAKTAQTVCRQPHSRCSPPFSQQRLCSYSRTPGRLASSQMPPDLRAVSEFRSRTAPSSRPCRPHASDVTPLLSPLSYGAAAVGLMGSKSVSTQARTTVSPIDEGCPLLSVSVCRCAGVCLPLSLVLLVRARLRAARSGRLDGAAWIRGPIVWMCPYSRLARPDRSA